MTNLAIATGALLGIAVQQVLYRDERQRFLRAIQDAAENLKNGAQ